MYIVNTTFIVSPSVHGNWYKFMIDKFIPTLIQKKVFTRLLSDQVEKHFTYSLQVYVEDIAEYKLFTEETLLEYQQFATEMFDTEVMHFTSLLKIIKTVS
ncbi:MAG: DUF4286 family protein [Rikenellaceae bacterium]